ncbi:class I SAM-dependent methyltransferase [Nodosilinea sp. PGN35]|uniref:class I SAM-dependent methyltransferase n=1 Tax=Nodosilinea sp. PGN35 TaxID=3020489 RepID=UPI0023B27644|nr:class I SAM-dependent methyltransferase [Nodosilinea sp. TSF1-S3]MDF0367605.1 class I SAM-dependent methyltransferase [Nodosilinea sp. TSF1-S3]
MSQMTWEESVQWLREQPDQQRLVAACYFDDPLLEAAQRFWQSDEWQATAALLPQPSGRALDLGAGRGIGSYALARDGWQVTALEPDPSPLVGAEAIRDLAQRCGLPIEVVSEYSERLPFADNTFAVVNCRQALHHAHNLEQTCREVYRVLKPGGVMIATREHVISQPEDLQAFLDSHPLHRFYGGEHAYLLSEYLAALEQAGLQMRQVLAPLDSPINYFPMTSEQWREYCIKPVAKLIGPGLARGLFNPQHPLGRWGLTQLANFRNRVDQTPGRLYTFVAVKPSAARSGG